MTSRVDKLKEREYRIAAHFGGELNLVVWQYAFQPPNFIPCACMYGNTIPYSQLNQPIMLKMQFGGKPTKLNDCQYFHAAIGYFTAKY